MKTTMTNFRKNLVTLIAIIFAIILSSQILFADGVKYYVNASAPDQGVVSVQSAKAFVDVIGSKQATIIFAHSLTDAITTYSFTTAITFPSNIAIEVEHGAYIDRPDKVTINGPFVHDLSQCFSRNYYPVFGTGSIKEAYPEWWGAVGDAAIDGTGTDNTAALQSSFSASKVVFLNSKYKITSPISLSAINGGYRVTGRGRALSAIYTYDCNAFNITSSNNESENNYFADFTLRDTHHSRSSVGINYIAYSGHDVIERMYFVYFTAYSIHYKGMEMTLRDNAFVAHTGTNVIHFYSDTHSVMGQPTTLMSSGNNFDFGSANAPYALVDLNNLATWTSIGDTFQNAGRAIKTSGGSGIWIINPHLENITDSEKIQLNDCLGCGMIGGVGDYPKLHWSSVPVGRRFLPQFGVGPYGTIMGVQGLSRDNVIQSFNLTGSVTISDTNARGIFSFPASQENNTDYKAVVTLAGKTGSPMVGAFTVINVQKLTSGIIVTINTAPGVGASVTYDIIIMR